MYIADIKTEGFGGVVPEEIEWDLHYGDDSARITIIDDESKRPYNQEWVICCVADVHCEDGTVRIGYYKDGANTVVDVCDGIETVEEWAEGWDNDSLLPCYLGKGD